MYIYAHILYNADKVYKLQKGSVIKCDNYQKCFNGYSIETYQKS